MRVFVAHESRQAEGRLQSPRTSWRRYEPDTALESQSGARGALEPGGFHSWWLDPHNAGDWAIFAPGRVQGLLPHMARPHGRIHFCGEHTATMNRGMEGAMESAERVALEVADRL